MVNLGQPLFRAPVSELAMTEELPAEDDGISLLEGAEMEGSGVQVDAGVESVLSGREAHQGLPGWVGA